MESLYQAILDNNQLAVKTLVDNSANINVIHNEETAVTFAIEHNCRDIALMLINSGKCESNAMNRYNRTPLFYAAKCGEVKLISALIEMGAIVDQQDINGVTPLGATAWYDKDEAAEVLIRAGANINSRNKNGETPIHRACNNVSGKVVKLLLRHGCDVNVPTFTFDGTVDSTPLMASVPSTYEREVQGKKMSAMIEIMTSLLRYGADTDAINGIGNTALHIAVERNEIHVAFLLMESGCNTSIVNNKGLSALNIALLPERQYYQMAFFLILFGFPNIDAMSNKENKNKNWIYLLLKGKRNPLASEAESQMIFRILSEESSMRTFSLTHLKTTDEDNNNCIAQPNEIGDVIFLQNYKMSEIPMSMQKLCRRIVRKCLGRNIISKMNKLNISRPLRTFLLYGLDTETCNPVTACELQIAVKEGDTDKLRTILQNGIDVNTSLFGKPPLVVAAEAGSEDCIKVLMDHGATPTIQDIDGNNALHLSAKNGQDKIIELLVPFLNHLNLQNVSGNKPLHEACSEGNLSSALMLLDLGSDPSVCDKVGIFPIHYAAGSGDVRLLECILEKNAPINSVDKFGNTALHVACSRGLLYLRENISLRAMFDSEVVMNLHIFKLMYSPEFTTNIRFKENVNHVECIKLLLSKNCNLFARNKDYKSAYQIAQDFGFSDIKELLESH